MAGSAPKTKKSKYAPTAWVTDLLMDLPLPSGQLCEVKRVGVTGLIKVGLLDSLDSLTAIVQTDHVDRMRSGGESKISPEDIQGLAGDAGRLETAMDLMDRVIEYVVNQPELLRPIRRDENGQPIRRPKIDRLTGEPAMTKTGEQVFEDVPLLEKERVAGQVYTDAVDLMDKTYIFQFVVGGVSDLDQFRKEFGETLGSMGAVQAVPDPAE